MRYVEMPGGTTNGRGIPTSWTGDESLIRPEPWTQWASCVETDPEIFFPKKGGSTQAAKRVCDGCAVREECLEFALRTNEQDGIYGGLSAFERRALRRTA